MPDASPSPTLSPLASAILTSFIDNRYDVAATLRDMRLEPLEFLAWHRGPAVQAALADLEALENQSARLTHAAAQRDAIHVLREVATDRQAHTIERRRAASAILRAFTTPQTKPNPERQRDGLPALPGAQQPTEKQSLSAAISVLNALFPEPKAATPRTVNEPRASASGPPTGINEPRASASGPLIDIDEAEGDDEADTETPEDRAALDRLRAQSSARIAPRIPAAIAGPFPLHAPSPLTRQSPVTTPAPPARPPPS